MLRRIILARPDQLERIVRPTVAELRDWLSDLPAGHVVGCTTVGPTGMAGLRIEADEEDVTYFLPLEMTEGNYDGTVGRDQRIGQPAVDA